MSAEKLCCYCLGTDTLGYDKEVIKIEDIAIGTAMKLVKEYFDENSEKMATKIKANGYFYEYLKEIRLAFTNDNIDNYKKK